MRLIKDVDVKIDYTIEAANDSSIKTFEIKLLELNCGFRKHYRFTFVVADTSIPILGADVLRQHHFDMGFKSSNVV